MAKEVDRLLAQLDGRKKPVVPHRPAPAKPDPQPTTTATIVWASTPAAPATPAVPTPAPRAELPINEGAALWGRVLLGCSLGLIMVSWPYAHACGWGLLAYSAAVATLLVTGAWIALVAWRQHNGPAHLLALVLFYWGLVLTAEQVLPRVGYGWTDASWTCSATRPPG
jgi:hypothetical protein